MTPERLAEIRRCYDGLPPGTYSPQHTATHAMELIAYIDELEAMRTQWSAVHPHPVREEPCRHLEFSDESSVRTFVSRRKTGWHVEHRRVGEWQSAENDTP